MFKWIKNSVFDPLTGASARRAGKEAAKAGERASQLQADYQQQALDLFTERTKLPTEIRDQQLKRLSQFASGMPTSYNLYGQKQQYIDEITGAGQQAQQQLGDIGSQFGEELGAAGEQYMGGLTGLGEDYRQSLLGGVDQSIQQGEEALLRRQGVTGGLRSGSAQRALSDRAIAMRNQAEQEAARANLGLGQLGFGAQLGAGQEAARMQAGLGQSGVQYATDAAMRGTGIGMEMDQLQRNLNRQSIMDRLGVSQGLAGLDTGAAQQAQMLGGIGQTLAQGITGAAQARQMGANQGAQQLMGLLNTGANIAKSAASGGAL